MIYFKKKKIKSVLLYLYKIFNSANVYLNIIFKNFKKKKIEFFFWRFNSWRCRWHFNKSQKFK